MNYRLLGKSGVKVSELCFGTMTFGTGFYGIGKVSQSEADEMVRYAVGKGINFFDTADVYSKGESETMLGNALRSAGIKRDTVIIATKVRGTMGEDINDVGLSRHHILNSVEASLKRLQVDYIDLYQVHSFDPLTPLKETMHALNDLVRWGKVRYIGASNFAAWQLSKANFIAKEHGLSQFISLQGYYSLIGRGIENELVPYCLDQRMGILTWSPLAGGLLSGKYRKGESQGRLKGQMQGFIPYDEATADKVLDELEKIAKAHNAGMAEIALAWLRARPAVTAVIIGARTIKQLKENISSEDITLSEEEVKRLEDASQEKLPYPQWMLGYTSRDRTK